MRYPKMQRQPRTTVTVPRLNGGVNLNDLPNHVNDNQLTACNNVWWHDGALTTRPGLTVKQEFTAHPRSQVISDREMLLYFIQRVDDMTFKFWAELLTASGVTEYIGSEDNAATIMFTTGSDVEADGYVDENEFSVFGLRGTKKSGYDWHFFWTAGGFSVLSWSNEKKTWDDPVPYIPLVMMNGKGNQASSDAKAVTVEATNVLSPQYRCTYTTDGASDQYALPLALPKEFGELVYLFNVTISLYSESEKTYVTASSVQARFTTEGGYFRFPDVHPTEYVTAPSLWGVDPSKYTAVYVKPVCHDDGGNTKPYMTFEAEGVPTGGTARTKIEGFVLPSVYGATTNNLEISMPLDLSKLDDIENMTQAMWFGGDRSGTDNGVHLFVAGNPDKPNLLHWSDLNNPLYFPENNYAYVGEESAPITALAKQGELLVIFREHDIYCAQYVAGDVPTAEELESGEAIETTVHKSYFPITQLHPNIGCDCPDTIRLVNNKLVWLTSDGRVHILTGANQYSERNVREASPLIEKELKKHSKEEMQAAVAGEYEGYYVLLIGNRMYLLDCQTSAFNSFQYYSREETAQKALPWYIWTLPERKYTAIVYDGHGLVIAADEGDGKTAIYTMNGDTDDGAAIESGFTTKLYDFARVDTKKSIDQVYISVGDVEGCRIRVGYVTDRYTVEDAYVIECTGETGGSVQPYRVTPNARLVQRFGLTLSAENPMTVSGLTIKYKNQGVVR